MFFPLAQCTEASIRHRTPKTPNESEFTEQCKALVSDTQYQYADGSSTASHQDLNCETPDGKIYTVEGEGISPQWIKSRLESHELISGDSDLILPAGAKLAKGKIKLNGPPELKNRPDKEKRRKLAQTGEKTVLVVRVEAPAGISTTATMAELADSVFGADSGLLEANDPVNLRSQYLECSHRKLSFTLAGSRPRVDTTLGGSSISNGAVTVKVNTAVSEGADGTMRNEISETLKTMFGVSSPIVLADYLMYCLPPGTMSGIAYAYINSW
eukprot:13397682-Ditylum_brightwellii.AAC.1